MEFTNAYILGIQRRSDYFGERTANYRSVDTISIEGYIDVRGTNTDYKGVRQALTQIDSYVTAADNQNVLEEIIINATGYGTGRLVSLDFPASSAVDENQIRIGKYTADIEVYNTGYVSSSFFGEAVPHIEYLESFGEDFSISLDQDNVYNLSHSLDILYLSGVTGVTPGGSPLTLDPIRAAKDFAQIIFNNTPSSFSSHIPDSYGSISSAAREYFNESYNMIDGTSTMSKKISLFPSGQTNYSFKVSNSFAFDAAGVITVSENGEISPRNPKFLENARDAVTTEIGNSYNRCNEIYGHYKNYLNTGIGLPLDGNNYTLNTTPISISKSINNSAGNATYSVQYTNNLGLENITSITERSISFDFDGSSDIITVSENGTVTSRDSKTQHQDPLDLIPSRSDVKARCNYWFTQNTVAGNEYILKNLNNKFTVGTMAAGPAGGGANPVRFGKQVSYTYSFTSDGYVFDRADDPVFARKKITHSDKIGVPNQSMMTIPNQPSQVLHTPGQTAVGSRSTKFEGQLRRQEFTNNLITKPTPTSAINTAKNECINDGYMVFPDNQLITSLDKGKIYVSNVSYNFGSDNSFGMDQECQFVMKRLDGAATSSSPGDLNLVFEPKTP